MLPDAPLFKLLVSSKYSKLKESKMIRFSANFMISACAIEYILEIPSDTPCVQNQLVFLRKPDNLCTRELLKLLDPFDDGVGQIFSMFPQNKRQPCEFISQRLDHSSLENEREGKRDH